MKHLLALIAILIGTTANAAIPSYEWVDVEYKSGENIVGTSRAIYLSSNEDETEHTYRLTAPGGGLMGSASITELTVLVREQPNLEFVISVIATGNLRVCNPLAVAQPNTAPTPWTARIGSTTRFHRVTAWGPERQDNDQNEDGIHEPREWIKVRVSWSSDGTYTAGSETFQMNHLATNGNTHQYQPHTLNITGQDANNYQARVNLFFTTDGVILGDTGGIATPGTDQWGKPAGHGDFIGPLDITDNDPAGVLFYEYVIVEMGPTIGGGGGDGIGPDGGHEPDPEDQDPDPPNPDDPEEEPPNEADKTIDCIEEFFLDFANTPSVQAFTQLTEFEGEEAATITLQIPWPGGSTEFFYLSTDTNLNENSSLPAGVMTGVEALRMALRTVLIVLFGWITLKAFTGVLVRW